jgi:hypothetical protein
MVGTLGIDTKHTICGLQEAVPTSDWWVLELEALLPA